MAWTVWWCAFSFDFFLTVLCILNAIVYTGAYSATCVYLNSLYTWRDLGCWENQPTTYFLNDLKGRFSLDIYHKMYSGPTDDLSCNIPAVPRHLWNSSYVQGLISAFTSFTLAKQECCFTPSQAHLPVWCFLDFWNLFSCEVVLT